MAKKARLDLNLNEKMVEIFDELGQMEGGSKSEIFRKAMLTYYFIKTQTSEGSKIQIKSEDSQKTKELVLL